MKFNSIDSLHTLELTISMNGDFDDDNKVQEAGISVNLQGHDISARYDILGYLRGDSQDHIAEFLEQLNSLILNHKGRAHLKITGTDLQNYNDRSFELYLFAVDNVGHLALQLDISGTNRSTVELPFKTKVSFEIESDSLLDAKNELQNLYSRIKLKT